MGSDALHVSLRSFPGTALRPCVGSGSSAGRARLATVLRRFRRQSPIRSGIARAPAGDSSASASRWRTGCGTRIRAGVQVATGELLELLLVDRGLVAEIEALEALHEREAARLVRIVTFLAVLEVTSSVSSRSTKPARDLGNRRTLLTVQPGHLLPAVCSDHAFLLECQPLEGLARLRTTNGTMGRASPRPRPPASLPRKPRADHPSRVPPGIEDSCFA